MSHLISRQQDGFSFQLRHHISLPRLITQLCDCPSLFPGELRENDVPHDGRFFIIHPQPVNREVPRKQVHDHLDILAVIHVFVGIDMRPSHRERLQRLRSLRKPDLPAFVVHFQRLFQAVGRDLLFPGLHGSACLRVHEYPYGIGAGQAVSISVIYVKIPVSEKAFKSGSQRPHRDPFSQLRVSSDFHLPVGEKPRPFSLPQDGQSYPDIL